jgi:hypothetical protein
VTENGDTYREMRGLAAELLRAQRIGDQAAFNSAMLRGQGRVPALLISLCGLSNNAITSVIGKDEADRLIARLSHDLPAPPTSAEQAADVWRDTAALVQALADGDEQAARVLSVNTPDLSLLFGDVLVVLDMLLGQLSEPAVAAVVDWVRTSPPPMP